MIFRTRALKSHLAIIPPPHHRLQRQRTQPTGREINSERFEFENYMAFILFKKEHTATGMYYSDARQGYKLAGYNLLYKLWNKRSKPMECGWSVNADDLLREHGEGLNGNDYALVIDFHPDAKHRIGLVEIEAIHIYTYKD